MKKLSVLALLFVLGACAQPTPEVVEGGRTVEVTRIVEVEVTRIVEVEILVAAEIVTPEPSDLEVIAGEWGDHDGNAWDIDVTVLVRNNSNITLSLDGDFLGHIEVKCLRPDGGAASLTSSKFVEAAPGEEVIRFFGLDLEFDFTCNDVDVKTSID